MADTSAVGGRGEDRQKGMEGVCSGVVGEGGQKLVVRGQGLQAVVRMVWGFASDTVKF